MVSLLQDILENRQSPKAKEVVDQTGIEPMTSTP